QFVNHQPQEIPEVIPFIESKEWIETKNELYKMIEAHMERINQQREQKALLAAQRERELLAQKQADQEKEEPPQNSDFRQLIGEIYGTKVCEEQKQNMEDTMLELLKNFKVIHKMSSISNTSQISSVIPNTPDLPTEELDNSLSMGKEHFGTIPKTESDEVIKSSVENLVPIPSESEVTSDNEKLNAEIADTIVESHSPSPIPVEDSDSQMEEIDLFLASDDLINDPLPLLENESSNFDHHDDPLFPRPPPEPSDVDIFFDFEPDTGVLTAKMAEDISEHHVLIPKVLPSQPTICPNINTLLSFTSEKEDKVFKPGILSYLLVSHRDKINFDFFENPMIISGEDIPFLDVLFLHFYPP
nr:hypothetical protein [Tanacetum cinerariifolium]